jgi:hypothetical protein
LDSITLSKYLVKKWEKCEHYDAKIIIIEFVIEIMASLKLDVHFAQQRFVIWKEGEVTDKSQLN